MKLLSIAIPSYNSQDYMANCIESLLPGGEDVEILIVNDGSKDNTAKIADEYQQKYPTICRAIHQENGGHGEAVNAGLRNATGKYFKVVDSDDWVDLDSLKKILDFLKTADEGDRPLDLLLSNFVYDKQGAKHKKVMSYEGLLPENQYFGWEQVAHFPSTKNILMHSVIYRTELLRNCNLELPKHTFYVDNLFVFNPLPHVKKMYYINTNFYRYFIGRNDQSVNEKVMISRIDQQLKVNRLMVDEYAKYEDKFENKNMQDYMLRYLGSICMISSVMLLRSGTKENEQKRRDLWIYVKEKTPVAFTRLRKNTVYNLVSSNNGFAHLIVKIGYKIARKLMGFN